MEDKSIIRAQFVDYKNVKTRSQMQLIFEVDISMAKHALDVLGYPDNSKDMPVAIARLTGGATTLVLPSSDQGKGSDSPGRKWSDLSYAERAGIRCREGKFQEYLSRDFMHEWLDAGRAYREDIDLSVKKAMTARDTIRFLCGVESRADIKPDTEAAKIFDDIEIQFKMWLQHEQGEER